MWLSAEGGAAAIWIPPGRPEIAPEAEAKVEPMLTELLGAEQTAILLETSIASTRPTPVTGRTTTSACSAPRPSSVAGVSVWGCSPTIWR